MLTVESAHIWYSKILQNDKTGNLEQKILGLRLIFDSLLLEMFPNRSGQDFYYSGIELIFAHTKSTSKSKINNDLAKKDFHKLRDYLNSIQHSKIEADNLGYITCIKRLANLIQFCSNTYPPDEITSLSSNITTKKNLVKKHLDNTSTVKDIEKSSYTFIIDTNSLSSNAISYIEQGLKSINETFSTNLVNIEVYSISQNTAKYTSSLVSKQRIFNFNTDNVLDLIKPLSDIYVHKDINLIKNSVCFLLSHGSVGRLNNIDINSIFKNDLNYHLFIHIDRTPNKIMCERDKCIESSNLPEFFDWVKDFINSNQ